MDNDIGNALALLGVKPETAGASAAPSIPSNNPGNLRPQGSSTGFQSFSSPQAGIDAIGKNLQAYAGHGINTINGVVNRWAPPTENNTAAYAADVSKRLGIAPDAQIDLTNPVVQHALTTAIMLHENGPKILTKQSGAGQTPQQQQVAQPQGDSDVSSALSMLNSHGDVPIAPAAPQAVAVQPSTPMAPTRAAGGLIGQPSTPLQPTIPQAAPYSAVGQALGDAKAGALGVMHGIDNTVAGGLQLGAHAAASLYPDSFPGSASVKGFANEADKQVGTANKQFAGATQGHEQAAGIGDTTGSIGGALALPESKLAEGANIFNKLIAAGKTGAIAGASQAVDPADGSYWAKKGEQAAVGAAGGLVGVPAAAVAGKVLGAVVDKGVALKNLLGSKFGAAADDAGSAAPVAVSATPNPTGARSSVVPAPDVPAGGVSLAASAQPAANAPKSAASLLQSASPELRQGVQAAMNKGEQVDPAALARQTEAQSLPVPVSLTKGQASQDPMQISTERNTRSQNPALVTRLNDQNTQLVQNLNHIRDTGAPDAVAPDHITAAETLINAGQKAIDAQQAQTSALYKKLTDANGGTLPLDGKTFATQASQALDQQMKAPFLPAPVQGILSKFQNGDQPMTFTNFENLRTILAAEGRKAAQSGDGNAAAAIGTVRNTLENMPMDGAAANVKPLADAARASARQGFQMIEGSPMLKAIDSGNASSKNLIEKYVVGANNRSDLINTAQALKDDPIALQTMKAGTINYLKSKAGITNDQGNFTGNGYNNALKAMGPKLDVLFSHQEAGQLRAVGNVARNIQAQPTGSYVNNSNTDVSNLARGAAGLVEHGLNVVTHSPAGSIGGAVVRGAIAGRQNTRALSDMLNPAAGTTVPNQARQKLSSLLGSFNPALAGGGLAGGAVSDKRSQ